MLQKFRQNLAKFEFATFKKLIFLKEKAHFKGSRLAANNQHGLLPSKRSVFCKLQTQKKVGVKYFLQSLLQVADFLFNYASLGKNL